MVVMYSRTCPHQTVNEARQVLFAQGNKSIENIPPTQAALAQHIKRAAYQEGHAWGQALEPMQELPSPAKNKARSEMGLAFISFYMPKGVRRPILALVSYFEQFYHLSSGLL